MEIKKISEILLQRLFPQMVEAGVWAGLPSGMKELPVALSGHCVVSLDQDSALVVGGTSLTGVTDHVHLYRQANSASYKC